MPKSQEVADKLSLFLIKDYQKVIWKGTLKNNKTLNISLDKL